MERATVTPPFAVVSVRGDGRQRSNDLGRTLRAGVVAVALVAGIASIAVLSSGGLPALRRTAGPVVLDEPTFGTNTLTAFPVKDSPSTDDLIAIMRGQGAQDVNADQGMLFAGGAGGSIVRKQLPAVTDDASESQEARGLWEAAKRAAKLGNRMGSRESSAGDDVDDADDDADAQQDAHDEMARRVPTVSHAAVKAASKKTAPVSNPPKRIVPGWTVDDEKHKSPQMAVAQKRANGIATASGVANEGAGGKKLVTSTASHSRAHQILRKIEKDEMVDTAAEAQAHHEIHPWVQPKVEQQADVKKGVKDAQDGYFRHHMSIDDALSRVAKIRAQHDAEQSAKAYKRKMAKVHKKELKHELDQESVRREKEMAQEHDEHQKAVAEAARAKAMEARAVKAAKEAESDEQLARREVQKEKQKLVHEHREQEEPIQHKQQLAHAKAVNAGWTQADAARAAHLAKKFALESAQPLKSYQTPEHTMRIYNGGKLAHKAAHAVASSQNLLNSAISKTPVLLAGEISPLYPTGFIPASKQHDDARQPDALPEMIDGIHGARKDKSLSAFNARLARESAMKSKEQIEEKVHTDEAQKQQQLYREGHTAAAQRDSERAGEELVRKLDSNAEVARVLEKVDLSGIPIASSLKEAIAGDEDHFRTFEQTKWMDRCGGSQLMLDPVAKQVLAIMEQINTKNASSWLDVEDAQRRADNTEAELSAAEAGLVSVLESEDRTKAVVLLETLRKNRQQRMAERKADTDTASDATEAGDKVSLLLQQRQALKVLSHAEEAQALSGSERRAQLNIAAKDAQYAVSKEQRLTSINQHSDYLPGFESALIETATKPWSLSAQEGVQTLLGSINSQILALEHTEQTRSKALDALEAKVAVRMHKLDEVNAADEELKKEVVKEHLTVQHLRTQANAATTALTRALRTYQVRLTQDAADLRGAHQVVDRLQALMAMCNSGMEAPYANLRSGAEEGSSWASAAQPGDVEPWVTKASSTPAQQQQNVNGQRQQKLERQLQTQMKKLKSNPASASTVAAQATVKDLEKELHQLKKGMRARSTHTHKHPVTQQMAAREKKVVKIFPRATPPQPRVGGGMVEENRKLAREIARADKDEARMEGSEERKLSSVAAMIVSDPHEGRR